MNGVLIRNARLSFDAALVDVRIAGKCIVAVAPALGCNADDTIIDAGGGALLPGLHDHHLHLPALAAALSSVRCGPPDVRCADDLVRALQTSSIGDEPHATWLRGIGYHESVAGNIDRDWLDAVLPGRPVRIQHRGGRLWIFNSAGLDRLAADPTAPLERHNGRLTGRLYDGDDWLRRQLASQRPSLFAASRLLGSRGVTAVSEVTPSNSSADYFHYQAAQDRRDLLQDLLVMGDDSLDALPATPRLQRGGTKLHLHESALPDFDAVCASIERSHSADRPVAIHCVTQGELIFSLEALASAGHFPGDRIEHAAVAFPAQLERIRELGVTAVTQPHFILERGDRYLAEVATDELDHLYRARSLREAGIAIAAGTDAPFGTADPWRAMQAAVDRRTSDGTTLGEAERLSPEDAYHLFSGPLHEPGKKGAALTVGSEADLCLIDRPWDRAREALAQVKVVATVRSGTIIWQADRTSTA